MTQETPDYVNRMPEYWNTHKFANYVKEVKEYTSDTLEKLYDGDLSEDDVAELSDMAEGGGDLTWQIRPAYDGDYLPDEIMDEIESIESGFGEEPEYLIEERLESARKSLEELEESLH